MNRWFDRTFELGVPASAAPALLARLGRTAERAHEATRGLSRTVLVHRPRGRWSIQENIGHLLDLESLWEQRLEDFEVGAEVLYAADLQNRRTHDARHNDQACDDVIAGFAAARQRILDRVGAMSDAQLSRTALHPRLQQPMSVVDLCFFVAEHDDHHLATIAEIRAALAGVPEFALDLLDTVERVEPMLLSWDAEQTAVRQAPGKWSPREVVGHLIDSASNNHQRFVRAVFQDDLVFTGYAQDDWVAVQRYQEAPWPDLVTLWASFNRHLARVMTAVPEDVRMKSHTRHTLDRVAFRRVAPNDAVTLDFFMADYVLHLHHHLRQIGISRG